MPADLCRRAAYDAQLLSFRIRTSLSPAEPVLISVPVTIATVTAPSADVSASRIAENGQTFRFHRGDPCRRNSASMWRSLGTHARISILYYRRGCTSHTNQKMTSKRSDDITNHIYFSMRRQLAHIGSERRDHVLTSTAGLPFRREEATIWKPNSRSDFDARTADQS